MEPLPAMRYAATGRVRCRGRSAARAADGPARVAVAAMTPAAFRKLALGLPQASEASHQGHPDFRVGKRVFATLGSPDAGSAMVKLTPLQQSQFVAAFPEVFAPVPGGWGRQGATRVSLRAATVAALRPAMFEAWRNLAPAQVVAPRPRT